MPYIGPEPNPGQNREVDDISSSFNGSTTAFTLQVSSQNVSPGSANAIIVSLGGVVQNPGTDYTVAASTLTFTTAPANGLSFFGLVLGQGIDAVEPADASVTATKLASPLDLPDNQKIRFGTGNDLEIFHSTHSDVVNSTNELRLRSNDLRLQNQAATQNYLKGVNSGAVELYHSGTKQCETSANGLAFPSGKGIDFSAVASGSGMTSELLDDYEEGTFSPIPDAGGGVTFTYAHNTGFYTKIGNTVTFQIYLMFYASTITGGNSGNGVAIQGLPFTIKNNARYNPAFTVGRTYNFDIDSDKRIYAYGDYNSTNIRMIVESDDNVGALLTAGQVDTSTCLTFITGTYQI